MAREGRRKTASIKHKKRRGFWGKRRHEMTDDNTSDANPQDANPSEVLPTNTVAASKSASSKKLLNSYFNKLETSQGVLTREQARKVGLGSVRDVESATGFKIQDAILLSNCISEAAICKSCRKATSKLQLYQRNNERNGLSESLFLQCSSCEVVTPLQTSNRLGGRGGGAHEVNRRAALASLQFGHAGLTKFCAGMGLSPPVSKDAYNKHLIQIEKAAKTTAEEVMKDAANRLLEKVKLECPDDIEEDGEDIIASVSVTVDGTWQKKGHSSKIGVVFVISVATGEILDYEVKSLFCHECKVHNKQDQESKEFQEWKKAHEPKCEVNHLGSSEEMEAVSAVDIFSRSMKTRKLKYTTFVGDGDSSSFGQVKEAMYKKYGTAYEIKKEECVGHVQKRLGSGLRKYKNDMKGTKLSDGKCVGKKGRLTDKMIDKMQNYYGKAIRGNKGNLEEMKTSIKAIQHHMIRNDKLALEEQHQFCPKSPDTWCKFWKDKADGTKLYNEDNRLPEVFMEELDPLFTRLSSDDLLNRCLKGLTQNQNEAANGVLWSKCPKTKFCGARRVRIAACETVAEFNTGAAYKAVIMNLCGVTPGANTMKALRKQDDTRLKTAAKKASTKYRVNRQKLRALRKSKCDKMAYQPGGFGLSAKPIDNEKKRKTTPRQTKTFEPQIIPTVEVVCKKRRT